MADDNAVLVVYDGGCPVCNLLILNVRLKDSGFKLILIDARKQDIYRLDWFPPTMNINSGMVVKLKNEIFFGDEALHVLSLISTKTILLNKIIYSIFSSRKFSKLLYPALRFGRFVLLKGLNRKELEEKS